MKPKTKEPIIKNFDSDYRKILYFKWKEYREQVAIAKQLAVMDYDYEMGYS